jgi:hypothetical protein
MSRAAGSKAGATAANPWGSVSSAFSAPAPRPPAIPSTRKPEPVPELVSGRDRPSQRRLTAPFSLPGPAHAAAVEPGAAFPTNRLLRRPCSRPMVVSGRNDHENGAGLCRAALCAVFAIAYQTGVPT